MSEHNTMTDEELAEIRELAEAANPKTVIALLDEVKRLREEVARLDKEADWLAQTAANSGWEGYRTCPERMRERARKAVEDGND